MDRSAAIIEVGLNEAAPRVLNPQVPYGPAECAADARRCADEGAAVVHWHARDPVTGAQRLGDTELYAAALAAMPATLLAYPSYPLAPAVATARLAHCWALRERCGLELAPVDAGSVNVIAWDERARSFVAIDDETTVVSNPLAFTLAALDEIYARGMRPSLGSFDVGITRTVALLATAGKLRPPVFLKIFLSGAWAVGPFPTEEALDFHLRQLPGDVEVEWVLVPYALCDPALVERLCRHALARGGGIRVGIGDNPVAHPGDTNAALVERAVRWAADAGRPVASPEEVRARLGLAARGACWAP